MVKSYKVYNNEKLNSKIIAKVSSDEKEFIARSIKKLNDSSRGLELSLSSFTRLATIQFAESINLGKFNVIISIPDRTLKFRLVKK